ncbi:hypothetical protein [Oceanobacillus chungangensis]|uniref:Uncharacterized protein n=1 Tax=Oceanobacillus chungangensis TaxID=1229152 RepID=A0A3D8Q1C3_9BACI|nr:hypothetical protein [Oceanobacillus chungangensis]RDW21209.1 hypothetical protein CWR45_02895 [Oceanobacillus chungangensis]
MGSYYKGSYNKECDCKEKSHNPHRPSKEENISIRLEDVLVQLQQQLQEQYQLQQQLQEQLQLQQQKQDQDQKQAQLDNDYSNFENIGNPTIKIHNDITIVIVLVILLSQRNDKEHGAGLDPLVPELMSMLRSSMNQ